jgi:hypothetical protein
MHNDLNPNRHRVCKGKNMCYEKLHKGDDVRLVQDYEDESRNYSAGERGKVCGFDDFLVIVTMSEGRNIPLPPQLLEVVSN